MSRKAVRNVAIALVLAALLGAAIPARPGNPHCERWHSGDIIFLNGTSLRSRVVRLLQGYSSDYSHVGIVIVEEGVPSVVHADPSAGKVIKQRWDAIFACGDYAGGMLYRLQPDDEPAERVACATAMQMARNGVPFDRDFDLKTADKLYCTELVWRAYQSAGIDLCRDAETQHRYLLPAHLFASSKIRGVVHF